MTAQGKVKKYTVEEITKVEYKILLYMSSYVTTFERLQIKKVASLRISGPGGQAHAKNQLRYARARDSPKLLATARIAKSPCAATPRWGPRR